MTEITRFLRYPGSKRKMLGFLMECLPKAEEIKGRYSEPFMGSCAVFFSLDPQNALLADINPDLVDLLSGIQTDPSGVWRVYRDFGDTKEDYHYIRDDYLPTSLTEKAARILFLNRTCFKGMWRTNLSGGFNVGYGGQGRRWAITEENLIAVSRTLKKAELRCSDFEIVISQSQSGDFLFLDPPYRPGEKELANGHYVGKFFKYEDQVRLSKSLHSATRRSVKWAMTISSHQDITKLYKNCYTVPIKKGTGRSPGIMADGPGEVLITNYPVTGGIRL